MKNNILIIGAGAVGAVVAHKCAQSSDVFASVCLASKNVAKCDAIIDSINKKKYNFVDGFKLYSREVNG
jgi:saccharopine dehydrogenase-like NADP-dependent oxidoreductase